MCWNLSVLFEFQLVARNVNGLCGGLYSLCMVLVALDGFAWHMIKVP